MREEENTNIGGTEENKDKEELEIKNGEGQETINGIKDCNFQLLLNNSIFKLQKKKLKKEKKFRNKTKKLKNY